MCGLAGFYINQSYSSESSKELIQNMINTLDHRGPDDSGIWVDPNNVISLGHKRLSILDISSAGHQPMSLERGKFVLTYNGEIYNHLELRANIEKDCKSIQWTGTSDTETLLAAFETWGIKKTLPQLRGMFAIAVYDKSKKKLSLIRDRFGEKPLYYGWVKSADKNIFSFGSELKAFSCVPEFNNNISKIALKEFFQYMYVPCPFSIYENIYKLEPGCILEIDEQAPNNPSTTPLHSSSDKTVIFESMALERWYDLKNKPDVIIFEGWCVGAKSEKNNTLKKTINSMEKAKDQKQIWRKYVNHQLKSKYKNLYSQLNCLIYLKAENFRLLQKWRLKQERKLWLSSKRKLNLKIMSKGDVLNFMQTYQRITQNMFRYMPKYASIILNLNSNHQIKSAVYKNK